MNIIRTNTTYNVHGYVNKVERVRPVRRIRDININVNDITYVQCPKFEDFVNLVVTHNTVESYI